MASDISWLRSEDGTKGEAWNPCTGCSPDSPGCMRCYAAVLASRGMSPEHRGLTTLKKRRNAKGKLVNLPVFNGVVHRHPERLELPMRKRKPKRFFVNSMSDLFHEDVPFTFIAAVLKTIALCPQHTFLALTKRDPRPFFDWASTKIPYFTEAGASWPLANFHLGVSAESQPYFDRRVPTLRDLPAGLLWVSIDPQLSRIDPSKHLDLLGWVVVGGESGAGSRLFDVDWAATIVDACVAATVPVFVKQLGSNPVDRGHPVVLADKKGEDWNEWTGDLARVRRREYA